MFEISISLLGPEGLRDKVVKTESFGLWINRYPEKHEHGGEIRDIRLIVREGDQDIQYAFVSFSVKEAPQ